MKKPALFSRRWPWALALLLLLLMAAGAWWYWVYLAKHPYSREIEQRANALQARIPALDAHLDVPLSYGTDGEEANRDGPTQFDLVKAAKGA